MKNEDRFELIVNRLLSTIQIDISDDLLAELIDRLISVNEFVQIINNSLNHNLNSTQVIAYITYEFLKERKLL